MAGLFDIIRPIELDRGKFATCRPAHFRPMKRPTQNLVPRTGIHALRNRFAPDRIA